MTLYKVICVAALLTLLAAVSIPNPVSEDSTSNITSNRKLRQKRSSNIPGASANLDWVYRSSGSSLPDGSVSFYNNYEHRLDYICQCGCHSGFHTARSNTCNYGFAREEEVCSDFWVLVNKDDFEALEWKAGSDGSVPQNAVKTCSDFDVYVAKNEYGLGKVHARHEAFYLPWSGSEYKYNEYEVLTMNKNIFKEHISDVSYRIDAAERFKHPPEVMSKSTIVNKQCREVTKTSKVSVTYEEEKRWDTSTAISAGVTASITTEIPFAAEIGIQLSTEVTDTFSSGTTLKESKSLAVDVEVTVPPNHSCAASIIGHKFSMNIPYTARLTRTYRNGETTSTIITGEYKDVSVVDFKSVVDRCVPIPNAKPCE
ncbi:natterin-3-like [Scomber japonicus]|uniref:natterin-3-like n=1 Tax=Scomber japonicus TaxID=13676 RepID=UPI0023053EED|nr:natterin-3-like [Scomber japonicus]